MAEGIIQRPMAEYEGGDFRASKHENITEAERGFYRKIGRIVIVDLSFTVGTAITGTTEQLFSGLPRPQQGFRFRVPSTYDTVRALRLGVTVTGTIINQYTYGNIQPGVYEGQMVYICQ